VAKAQIQAASHQLLVEGREELDVLRICGLGFLVVHGDSVDYLEDEQEGGIIGREKQQALLHNMEKPRPNEQKALLVVLLNVEEKKQRFFELEILERGLRRLGRGVAH